MTQPVLPFREAWNPYFVAYASWLGLAPSDGMPDGWAADYIVWISGQWARFCADRGIDREEATLHAVEFGAWLAVEYPERAS